MDELTKKIKQARFVWIVGNGGSASTAEHFTTDLIKKGIPAICLNSNSSVLTMISNDYGYAFVFSKQLDALANKEDLLITISCSGSSPNILTAISNARIKGMKIYEFEKFGKIKDYGFLEDRHLQFAHEVAKAL